MNHKLAIIGAGSVGASIAYAAIMKSVAHDILLVDINQERCEGEVLDLSDAAFLSDSRIKAGTFKEAGQCDIIVITAGAKQRPGETRMELIDRNYKILDSCLNEMKPFKPSAILLLVANPVDVLTFLAQKISGLPPKQVLGSGTYLDSARLRNSLSQVLGIAETAIHAHILGEHGDSQFPAWSVAHVATRPLLSFPQVKDLDLVKIAESVKNKAYTIIDRKGSTYYGIGGCTASLCESIFHNTHQVRPVSHYLEEYGVCMSLPAVIGIDGVLQTIVPPLNDDEKGNLEKSAASIRSMIKKFDL